MNYGFNRGLNEAQCGECETIIYLDEPGNEDVDLENPVCVRCRAEDGGGNDPSTKEE